MEKRLAKYCDGNFSVSTDTYLEGSTLAVGDYFVATPSVNLLHNHVGRFFVDISKQLIRTYIII